MLATVVVEADSGVETTILLITATTLIGWIFHVVVAAWVAWKAHIFRNDMIKEITRIREDLNHHADE